MIEIGINQKLIKIIIGLKAYSTMRRDYNGKIWPNLRRQESLPFKQKLVTELRYEERERKGKWSYVGKGERKHFTKSKFWIHECFRLEGLWNWDLSHFILILMCTYRSVKRINKPHFSTVSVGSPFCLLRAVMATSWYVVNSAPFIFGSVHV